MKVLICSCVPGVRRASLRSRKGLDIEVLPLSVLRHGGADLAGAALVYLDAAGLSERELLRTLGAVSRDPTLHLGVFDRAGSVEDVAALFHAGAVDYLGKKLAVAGLTAKRVSAALAYAPAAAGGVATRGIAEPSGNGWLDIEPGREYRFAFLSVEVDGAEELKKRHEPERLATAMETFRGFVERVVTEHGGRLWMWTRFGGLALFPALSGGGVQAMLCGLRIMLSRIFYDVEESLLPGLLSFRMALSMGTTTYHERDTGGIVSDGVNSVFHLGRRFARPGQFLLTAEACELAPGPLQGHFAPAGSFEGRRIMRMLRPGPLVEASEGGP